MKKHFFYRSIFINIFLFALLLSHAQNRITVKVSVDKNRILLGEHFELTLQVTSPLKETAHFWSVDNIPHFEIVSKEKIDTSNADKTITLKQIIQLTSFDSGHWFIPSFYLEKRIRTDSIPVDVVFSDFDSKQPYHDIKDIIEVNSKEKNTWWLYLVLGGVVLLAGVIILLRRKKKTVVSMAEVVDPFKEAMLQLEKLQKEDLSAHKFYTKLVNIFRLYIFRRKGIHSLQQTTDDLIIQLRNINMNKEQFEKLFEALRLSDAVKFAKYIPGQEDNRIVFETVKKTIQAIEQLN